MQTKEQIRAKEGLSGNRLDYLSRLSNAVLTQFADEAFKAPEKGMVFSSEERWVREQDYHSSFRLSNAVVVPH